MVLGQYGAVLFGTWWHLVVLGQLRIVLVGTRYYWVSDSVWGTGQYRWLVLGGTVSERHQNIRVPNSTCLQLILSHALLIIATSFKVWNMQMIHTYAEKVWVFKDL